MTFQVSISKTRINTLTGIQFQIIGIKALKLPNKGERFRLINHHLLLTITTIETLEALKSSELTYLAFQLAHMCSSDPGQL